MNIKTKITTNIIENVCVGLTLINMTHYIYAGTCDFLKRTNDNISRFSSGRLHRNNLS